MAESAVDAFLQTLSKEEMLKNVSRLGVAISGGADSLTLLDFFCAAVSRGDLPAIEIVPVFIDQYLRHPERDTLKEYVASQYSRSLIVRQEDTRAIADRLVASNRAPCRGCAPVRASALSTVADDCQLDAIALGHHLVDVISTLLMNMFHRGRVETMQPVTYRRSNLRLPIIRPLYYLDERQVKSLCPAGPGGLFECERCELHASERARTHDFIQQTFQIHAVTIDKARQLLVSLKSQTPNESVTAARVV